jgi:hypothetical protein
MLFLMIEFSATMGGGSMVPMHIVATVFSGARSDIYNTFSPEIGLK